jgi:transposase-like protein
MDSEIYQKWIEDIDALSEAQREEVRKILGGRSSEAEVIAALEGRLLADRVCPLCQRQGAVCRGRANGLRRFSCACGKTFNALTGTPTSYLAASLPLSCG